MIATRIIKTAVIFFSIFLFLIGCARHNSEMSSEPDWDHTDSLDAVAAAPNSHIVLLENDEVRVLRVALKPGEKEPMHTHRWKSVMYIESPARIRYFNENGEIAFETSREEIQKMASGPIWFEPERLHAVENIDDFEFSALRVEIKK